MAMPDTFVMARSINELRTVSAWLRGAMAGAGLSPAMSYTLELCANEALANVLMHAKGETGDPIRLSFACTEGQFELTIAERSAAFDPLSAVLPPPETCLETARPNGRGLALMRNLLPGSRYTREGEHNILTLTGHCS